MLGLNDFHCYQKMLQILAFLRNSALWQTGGKIGCVQYMGMVVSLLGGDAVLSANVFPLSRPDPPGAAAPWLSATRPQPASAGLLRWVMHEWENRVRARVCFLPAIVPGCIKSRPQR